MKGKRPAAQVFRVEGLDAAFKMEQLSMYAYLQASLQYAMPTIEKAAKLKSISGVTAARH